MTEQTFRDLKVWQDGLELAVGVHAVSKGLPTDDKDDLANQLRRAAYTVPAKIAHGHGRRDLRAYISNLELARAALAEVASGLEILRRIPYAPEDDVQTLLRLTSSIERQLLALDDALRVRLGGESPFHDSDEL